MGSRIIELMTPFTGSTRKADESDTENGMPLTAANEGCRDLIARLQNAPHSADRQPERGGLRCAVAFGAAFLAVTLGACTVNTPRASSSNAVANTTAPQQLSNVAVASQATETALQRAPTAKTKVALLLPLSKTGQTAEIAKGLKQAGELALFEFRDSGLQLVVKDTAGTPEGATAAADAALAAGAEIIIGPLFASSVKAVSAVTVPRGVPVVAFSNNETVAGNGVYLLSFQARQEVDRAVAHAVGLGKRRFAALIPDTAYGKVLDRAFQQAVARHGGQILVSKTYPPGANGMLETSQELFEKVAGADELGAPVDAVFVPGDQATLPTLGPIVTYTKIDTSRVALIGDGGWDYRGLGRIKAFRGGIYAAPDPRGWTAFSQKYVSTYGSAPPRVASFAYDGVAIAAALASRGSGGERFQASRITAPAGFAGVDGPVRFLANGLSERGLAVLSVTEYGTQVVAPAPSTFAQQVQSTAAVRPRPSTDASPVTSIFQQ